ncbi:pyridine nucleotide-disulfide oxidoreductase, partial [candidate division GN15 bacterium]|nr:pyridine nucleotide-disulfide oxidoreductase [candidate division GN15 bacterium]
MNASDFVIIGGVACGPKTAAALARRLPEASITLFQKESRVSYGTCGMPYFASGDINSFEELTFTSYGVPRNVDFFRKTKGFDVVPSTEVVAIDREKKTITVKDLAGGETREHGYGKLVIATGASPTPPPFPAAESDRVRSFTRPDDAIAFRQMAQTGQVGSALVIGGGFIGCEVAEATGSLWGIETT